MKFEFHTTTGVYLGSSEDRSASEIKAGESIVNSFKGQPHSEWEVVQANAPVNNVQQVRVKPLK